jgi:hypothetical protein
MSKGGKSRKLRESGHEVVKEALKETHFFPFYCASCHCLVVFITFNSIFRTKIREWFLAFLQTFVGLQSFWQYKILDRW